MIVFSLVTLSFAHRRREREGPGYKGMRITCYWHIGASLFNCHSSSLSLFQVKRAALQLWTPLYALIPPINPLSYLPSCNPLFDQRDFGLE
ncbi:hypothetical protein LguiA_005118 [Lonicera macranthoides]